MKRYESIIMGLVIVFTLCFGPQDFSDSNRQSQAKGIISAEFGKLSFLPQSISSKHPYKNKPSYVEWLFSAPENYEKFRKNYMKKALENDWHLAKEERQGENGEMVFYKSLPEDKGECELFFSYDGENKQFVCRITWLEKNSTK